MKEDIRTPGPWTIEIHGSRIRIRAINSFSHEESIALVPVGKMANARLIAACPDLLDALNRIIGQLNELSYDAREAYKTLGRIEGIAQIAITKAKGGIG